MARSTPSARKLREDWRSALCCRRRACKIASREIDIASYDCSYRAYRQINIPCGMCALAGARTEFQDEVPYAKSPRRPRLSRVTGEAC